MLYITFDQSAATEKKDVMLYGLTILGTIIGYYFGRVPAERRAESAEQNATGATTTAARAQQGKDEATKKLTEAKVGIERAKAVLAPSTTTETRRKTLGAGGAPNETATEADRTAAAYMELEMLSRQL